MSAKAELFVLSCDISYYLNHFEDLPDHIKAGLARNFNQRMQAIVVKGITEDATNYHTKAMLSLKAFEANLNVSV